MSSDVTPAFKLRALWHAIGACLIALVIYLSLTPDPPRFDVPTGSTLGHFYAYFVLMMWFAQLAWRHSNRLRIALAFALMGVALEFVQATTPTRTLELSDMLLNAAGIGTALLLARHPVDRLLVNVEAILFGARP